MQDARHARAWTRVHGVDRPAVAGWAWDGTPTGDERTTVTGMGDNGTT